MALDLADGTGPAAAGDGDFPFLDADPRLAGVLADAYVAYPGGATAVPPLRVAWLAGLDAIQNGGTPGPTSDSSPYTPTPGHAADVVVLDSAGAVVFDSTAAGAAYAATNFGANAVVHEWALAPAVCRLVQRRPAAPGPITLLPAALVPADGRLDARCCAPAGPALTGLQVGSTGAVQAGDLRLQAGYNVTLTPGPTQTVGRRRVTPVVVAAAPGGGIGRAPGCTAITDPALRAINGTAGDAHGNFNLAAGGCLWCRQPVAGGTPTPATLAIGGDCQPCCTCADYLAVHQAVLRTWGALGVAAGAAKASALLMAGQVDRWAAQKACREAQAVRINALASPPYIDVAASLCNVTGACLVNSVLTISAGYADPTTTVAMVAGSAVTADGTGRLTNVAPAFLYGTSGLHNAGSVSWTFPLIMAPGSVALRVRLLADPTAGVPGLTVEAAALAGGNTYGPVLRTF